MKNKHISLILIILSLVPLMIPNCYASNAHRPIANTQSLSTSLQTGELWIKIFQLMKKGSAFHEKKEYRTAITHYEEAIIHYKKNPEERSYILAQIYNNLGECHFQLEEYKLAEPYYNKSIKI